MIEFKDDFVEVLSIIQSTRSKVLQKINTDLINLYWQIGEYISRKVENERWGKSVVKDLANFIEKSELNTKGFSDKNLWRMKQFYEAYKDKSELIELTKNVSWTHNLLIFSKAKTDEERTFYLKLSTSENLSKRELERQIESAYFERTILANQKLSPVVRQLPQDVTDVFKDTYTFEFLNLQEPYSEKTLQKALIQQLKNFILELGNDFIFIGEEYRVQVGNTDFYIDLLFFHRELRCLVSFELKINDFKPEYIGKLNFYLEALDRDVKKPHENPSIGVLLCKSKDDEIVEYAMSRNISPTLVSDYTTKLIDKNILKQKLNQLFKQTSIEGNL